MNRITIGGGSNGRGIKKSKNNDTKWIITLVVMFLLFVGYLVFQENVKQFVNVKKTDSSNTESNNIDINKTIKTDSTKEVYNKSQPTQPLKKKSSNTNSSLVNIPITIDSILVEFNLMLGHRTNDVKTSLFIYNRKFAKGEEVNIKDFSPILKDGIRDLEFCGWSEFPNTKEGKFDFEFEKNTILYAVWKDVPLPDTQSFIRGTKENPIKITKYEELKQMNNSDKYFELANNIIISSPTSINKFKGHFNGKNNQITTSTKYFIYENLGTIKNVKLLLKNTESRLCYINKGEIDTISVLLDKKIDKIEQSIISCKDLGNIGKINARFEQKILKIKNGDIKSMNPKK